MNFLFWIILALSFLPLTVEANCASRVLTDKLTDSRGQELMSSREKISCADGSPSLDALVGIDEDCNLYEIHGFPQMACRYPNGRWEVIGDIETFDSFTGGDAPLTSRSLITSPVMNSYGSPLLNGLLASMKNGGGVMDEGARQLHERALILTLERASNGEVVAWNYPESGESGRLKAVHTRPVSGGICRKVLVELFRRGETGQFTETACRDHRSQSWRYLD